MQVINCFAKIVQKQVYPCRERASHHSMRMDSKPGLVAKMLRSPQRVCGLVTARARCKARAQVGRACMYQQVSLSSHFAKGMGCSSASARAPHLIMSLNSCFAVSASGRRLRLDLSCNYINHPCISKEVLHPHSHTNMSFQHTYAF